MTLRDTLIGLGACLLYEKPICEKCPYNKQPQCKRNLVEDIINIIDERNAEILRMQEETKNFLNDVLNIAKETSSQIADIMEAGEKND